MGIKSTGDLQARQRLLLFFHSGVGDPSAEQVERRKFDERLQMREARIGDLGTGQANSRESHFDGLRRGGFFAPSDLMMRLPFPLDGNGTLA
jgi:hypothetical protein